MSYVTDSLGWAERVQMENAAQNKFLERFQVFPLYYQTIQDKQNYLQNYELGRSNPNHISSFKNELMKSQQKFNIIPKNQMVTQHQDQPITPSKFAQKLAKDLSQTRYSQKNIIATPNKQYVRPQSSNVYAKQNLMRQSNNLFNKQTKINQKNLNYNDKSNQKRFNEELQSLKSFKSKKSDAKSFIEQRQNKDIKTTQPLLNRLQRNNSQQIDQPNQIQIQNVQQLPIVNEEVLKSKIIDKLNQMNQEELESLRQSLRIEDQEDQEIQNQQEQEEIWSQISQAQSRVTQQTQKSSKTYISQLEKKLDQERMERLKLQEEVEELKRISSTLTQQMRPNQIYV